MLCIMFCILLNTLEGKFVFDKIMDTDYLNMHLHVYLLLGLDQFRHYTLQIGVLCLKCEVGMNNDTQSMECAGSWDKMQDIMKKELGSKWEAMKVKCNVLFMHLRRINSE